MTAILETIIAVVAYWWIALKVGVMWPLLVSAAVAPMVLLRSEQSTALGVKWFLSAEKSLFDEWSNREDEIPELGKLLERYPRWVKEAVIIAITYGLMCSIGFFIAMIAWIVLRLGGKNASGGALLLIASVMAVILGTRKSENGIYFLLVPAAGSILLLISFALRIAATFCYLPFGIVALPTNFRRLVICTSPKQAPELVPDLNLTTSQFTFSRFILAADTMGD